MDGRSWQVEVQQEGGSLGMSGTLRPSYAVSPGPHPSSLYCGTPSPKIGMLLLPFKADDLPQPQASSPAWPWGPRKFDDKQFRQKQIHLGVNLVKMMNWKKMHLLAPGDSYKNGHGSTVQNSKKQEIILGITDRRNDKKLQANESQLHTLTQRYPRNIL